MRFSGLIPLAVVLTLSAAVIAIANAHGWSDGAAEWVIVAIIGGTTVADLLLTDLRELRLRKDRKRRGGPHFPGGRRGTT